MISTACVRLLVPAVIACLCATLPSTAAAKPAAARLAPANASVGARVGAAVDADKDIVVVGAPDDDEAGPFAGAAYIYVQNGKTWQKPQKLLGPSKNGYTEFGDSVGVSGNTIVIGAPF